MAQARSPAADPLPVGFRLQVDPRTQRSDGGRVVDGGSPWRMLRLSERGADVVGRLSEGDPDAGDADALLSRGLLEAGLAHPRPPSTTAPSLSVVVPVRDRASEL